MSLFHVRPPLPGAREVLDALLTSASPVAKANLVNFLQWLVPVVALPDGGKCRCVVAETVESLLTWPQPYQIPQRV